MIFSQISTIIFKLKLLKKKKIKIILRFVVPTLSAVFEQSRCNPTSLPPREMSRRSLVFTYRPPMSPADDGLWPRRRVKSWKPVIRAANGRRWPPWCSFRGGAWCCVTSDCVRLRLRLRFRVGAYGTCGCRVCAAPYVERVGATRQRRHHHHLHHHHHHHRRRHRRRRRCHPRGCGRGNTEPRVSVM